MTLPASLLSFVLKHLTVTFQHVRNYVLKVYSQRSVRTLSRASVML
jgi:hypothetical protein